MDGKIEVLRDYVICPEQEFGRTGIQLRTVCKFWAIHYYPSWLYHALTQVTNTTAHVFFSPFPNTGPIWILKYSMTTHLCGGWVQYRHLPKEITESHSGRALGSEMRDGILASILPKITQMTRGEACAGQGSFWSYPGHWLLVHVFWHVQAPEKKVRWNQWSQVIVPSSPFCLELQLV